MKIYLGDNPPASMTTEDGAGLSLFVQIRSTNDILARHNDNDAMVCHLPSTKCIQPCARVGVDRPRDGS